MASEKPQAPEQPTHAIVTGFEEGAKNEIEQIFRKGRAQLEAEVKAVAVGHLKRTMSAVAWVLLVAVGLFPGWSMWACAAPEPKRIIACLGAIAILLVAFLGVLLVFSKATRSGNE